MRDRVERILESMLATGASVDKVASALGLSRQTLFRRLKEEGTTFERIVDDLRKQRAFQQLTEERQSVKHVALELGFSDATAFSRAFKRWTGASPRAYLARAGRASGPSISRVRHVIGDEPVGLDADEQPCASSEKSTEDVAGIVHGEI